MAIKGKSKSRGGAKSVTRGPKPVYVPVKTPLLRRRSFWITVGVIVAVAAVAGISYGIAKQQTQNREEALAKRLRTTTTTFQNTVDPILATVGQADAAAGFVAFPGYEQALAAFADGSATPKDLQTAADGVTQQAGKAANQLEAVDVVSLVRDKGFDRSFVTALLNAQARMTTALRLYDESAKIAQDALTATGDLQTELVARAQGVLAQAKRLFTDGYQDYIEAQAEAGTLAAAAPPALPGLSGATGAP